MPRCSVDQDWAAKAEALLIATDEAQFEESKHPRDADGEFASKGEEGDQATEKNKADFVEAAKGISEQHGSGSLTSGDKKLLVAAQNDIDVGDLSGLLTATEKHEIEKYYGSVEKALQTAKEDPDAF